jgi:integrase
MNRDDLHAFAQVLAAEGVSENTRSAYMTDAREFVAFGGSPVAWFASLEATGRSKATRCRKWAALRKFLRATGGDTSALPKPPRNGSRLPEAVSPEEFAAMEGAIPDPPKGARLRALVWLLYGAGLRRSEAAGARWGDLVQDKGHRWLLVRGKGDKERRVPLMPQVATALDVWFATAAMDDVPTRAESPVFPLHADPGWIWDAIHNLSVRALAKPLHPHQLRHGFATFMLNALPTSLSPGMALLTVAALMGHASVTTTQRYCHVQDSQKADLVDFAALRLGGAKEH